MKLTKASGLKKESSMTRKCDRSLHPEDRNNSESCPNFATHSADGLGGLGEVYLCQEHAADPQTEGWYLEPPTPLTDVLEHVWTLLDEAHDSAVYVYQEVHGGSNHGPARSDPMRLSYSVRAPGPLFLGRKDGLDGAPFEWSMHQELETQWSHQNMAEARAKKAPKWWGSTAYHQLKNAKAAAAKKAAEAKTS